jgi:hypothetical protein
MFGCSPWCLSEVAFLSKENNRILVVEVLCVMSTSPLKRCVVPVSNVAEILFSSFILLSLKPLSRI